MSNKTYDNLKNVALILPLFITCILTIMTIWNIPYAEQIGLTLTAIETLIAGIVKIASVRYKKKQIKDKEQ